MQTLFDPRRFYTHLSLILFVIALALPRSIVKTALLLNSIFVGIMGNLVIMRKFDEWSRVYPTSHLLAANFVSHTLPMFLSFIVLLGCPPQHGETNKILLLLTGVFMLWATIPYEGKSMGEKVYDSYGVTIGVLIVGTVLLTLSTCHAMRWHRT
jgi:hypothetical protein